MGNSCWGSDAEMIEKQKKKLDEFDSTMTAKDKELDDMRWTDSGVLFAEVAERTKRADELTAI